MRRVIGIDEVGRGALAGPVVVAAAMIACRPAAIANLREQREHGLAPLKDSKKLSARQRELWYEHLAGHPKIFFVVARVYPRQIEKRNVSGAANLAALRAYRKLVAGAAAGRGDEHAIFLDGGLFLGDRASQAVIYPNATTIVKADEKIAAVAIASIVAKVHRDRFMKKIAKKYGQYGFEVHKGYGTKRHKDAIRKNGPSVVHRLTFIAPKYRI